MRMVTLPLNIFRMASVSFIARAQCWKLRFGCQVVMAPPDLVVPLPLEFAFMTILTQALYSVLLPFRLIHISVNPHPTSDNAFRVYSLFICKLKHQFSLSRAQQTPFQDKHLLNTFSPPSSDTFLFPDRLDPITPVAHLAKACLWQC